MPNSDGRLCPRPRAGVKLRDRRGTIYVMRFACALIAVTLPAQAPPTPALYHPAPEERRVMERKVSELETALRPLRNRVADDVLVDAEVYLKAAQWVLR